VGLEDIEVGQMYWLMEAEVRVVMVKIMKKSEDGTVDVRLPNGAIQSAFPDELEEV
jgi:hypothetical protein